MNTPKYHEMMAAGIELVMASPNGADVFIDYDDGKPCAACALGSMKLGYQHLTGNNDPAWDIDLMDTNVKNPETGEMHDAWSIICTLFETEGWSRERVLQWLREQDL